MVSKEKTPIPTAVSRARAFIVESLSMTNKFTFTTAAVKTPIATPVRTARTQSSMVEVYIVFKTYSIFLMPCFTGMRDGAGSAGFTGSDGGGAGLSLVMIASRW